MDARQRLKVFSDLQLAATMGPKMQGAILNGLFNLSSPIPFKCSTGNCQWDEFSTLAVTSSCQNVTSSSDVLCRLSGGRTNCNYTTPSGMMIRAVHWSSSGAGGNTYFNSTAFKPLSYDNGPISGRDELINSTIARISVADMQGWRNVTTPDILECNMRLCARVTRNLTITNGTFNPGVSEDIEIDGVPGKYEENIKPGISSFRDWYTFNITGDHPSFPGNRSFSYNMIDIEGVKKFLYDIFTSDNTSPYYLPLMNSTDHAGTVASISESMSYAFAQAPSEKAWREELSALSYTFEFPGFGLSFLCWK